MKVMVARSYRLPPEVVEEIERLAAASTDGNKSVNHAMRIVVERGLKAIRESR